MNIRTLVAVRPINDRDVHERTFGELYARYDPVSKSFAPCCESGLTESLDEVTVQDL